MRGAYPCRRLSDPPPPSPSKKKITVHRLLTQLEYIHTHVQTRNETQRLSEFSVLCDTVLSGGHLIFLYPSVN